MDKTRKPADGAQPAVLMEGVYKQFGAFTALHDISLAISNKERVVICGPSGSGKSTLIRCINHIEKHNAGAIIVGGVPLDSNPRNVDIVRRSTGMVFQNFNLFPHKTILENCTLAPTSVLGLAEAQARERAMHFLSKVKIPEQADKYPGYLSGGQQQRVAIARALCMKPSIMLFDEPTSALDPEMVQEVLDTMIELAEEGMTMICVTHEMGFAREVADRVVFMDKGRIVDGGSPQEFFKSPNSERAREFLKKIIH